MMRHLFTLFLITISLPLLAQLNPNTLTEIKGGNAYALNEEGATYTVTSNGTPVNARFIVKKSAKLILDNCHILRTSSTSPITFDADNITLEIQIRGKNTLCANRDNTTLSIITSSKNNSTIIFAEAPNAPTDSELLLRGCSTQADAVPPVQLNETSSIIFRSGTVRIATSEDNTTPYYIPSLASAKTVTLCGGTVIAQICPRGDGSSPQIIGTTISKCTNSLFDCTSFSMTSGLITTEGNACFSGTHTLKCTSTSYDTYFAYNATLMDNITNAAQPLITGGIRKSSTKCYIHGLPINTEIPAGTFSYEGSNELNVTSDNTGTITIDNVGFYPGLTFNYADATSEAIVKVFNATPMPSEKGCTAEADFGISNITLNAETLYPELHLTLDLHDDPSAVLEKTVYVRIYCTVNTEDRVMIAEQPLTFTRNAAGKPFTATFTDVSKARSASTTTRYTIEAYN